MYNHSTTALMMMMMTKTITTLYSSPSYNPLLHSSKVARTSLL